MAQIEDIAQRSIMGCENVGLCTACGFEQDCVESDASGYECEDCGEAKVCGAEILMFM